MPLCSVVSQRMAEFYQLKEDRDLCPKLNSAAARQNTIRVQKRHGQVNPWHRAAWTGIRTLPQVQDVQNVRCLVLRS